MTLKLLHILFSFLLFFLLGQSNNLTAQGIRLGSGTGGAHPSSMLHLDASLKGVLIPRMSETDRLAISSPAKGLLVFQNNGFEGFYYFDGSGWDTLKFVQRQNTTAAISKTNIAIVSDVKASGIDGGIFNSGSWITRDLNRLEGDSSFISIDNINTFTLDSGIYQINANAPAVRVGGHQIRLYNTTDSEVVALGTVVRSAVAGPNSIINTIFDINSTTTFQIQHRCENSLVQTEAMGPSANWGDNIYTQVRIRKM